MHKSTWSLCFQCAAALCTLAALWDYAFQRPKGLDKPALFSPYVYLYAEDAQQKASSIAIDQAAFLDSSPLFLATPLNATCHPGSYLDLSQGLPLADVLDPILSLSQNLQVLPLQKTTVEDPLELIKWNYSIKIDLPGLGTPPKSQNFFSSTAANTQLLDLFSSQRTLLSLALKPQSLPLPLLEDLHILVLKDHTGYTLPFLKLNTLGEEALDLSALEALDSSASLKEGKSAYYEFAISL